MNLSISLKGWKEQRVSVLNLSVIGFTEKRRTSKKQKQVTAENNE